MIITSIIMAKENLFDCCENVISNVSVYEISAMITMTPVLLVLARGNWWGEAGRRS